jgi:hypothetical protein
MPCSLSTLTSAPGATPRLLWRLLRNEGHFSINPPPFTSRFPRHELAKNTAKESNRNTQSSPHSTGELHILLIDHGQTAIVASTKDIDANNAALYDARKRGTGSQVLDNIISASNCKAARSTTTVAALITRCAQSTEMRLTG